MNKPTILMIDDDPVFLENYVDLLGDEYRVQGAADLASGLALIEKLQPKVLLLDITLKTQKEGLAALQHLKTKFPQLIIIMVTNWDSYVISQEALALGADNFFVKTENINDLKMIIKDQIEKTRTDAVAAAGFPIAESPAFQQVLKEAKKAAGSPSPVLLTGESGAGKEVVARYIHRYSQRSKGPFYALNCGAIPRTLLESELFGHEKGAFTGAHQKKIGKFEIVNGGTLFLDEIDSLPFDLQVTLLRVIENNEIERVGGIEKIAIDVRIIAAAKSDLKAAIQQSRFRDDLYYRLAVYLIHIPLLRDRTEDIIPLSHYFLQHFVSLYKTRKKQFSQSALLMLKNYHWPGNVRELRNVIERAVIRSERAEIRPLDFLTQDWQLPEMQLAYESDKDLNFRAWQRGYVKAALARNQGNISHAATEIGISRQGLTKIIQDLHLDIDVEAED